MCIEQHVKSLFSVLEKGNGYHERVTLVAATKTRTADEIQRAINAGVTAIGENKVQEFRDKFDFITGAERHFIGHLQTNKIKYLIGKCDLYHSIDRDSLANELARKSQQAGIVSDILIQINIGNEESKGGYPLQDGERVLKTLSNTQGLRVRGFMAMLPQSEDKAYLTGLCKKMRALYEREKEKDNNIAYLSMGMSGDWELCLENGSNMIRLGTAIFGSRT